MNKNNKNSKKTNVCNLIFFNFLIIFLFFLVFILFTSSFPPDFIFIFHCLIPFIIGIILYANIWLFFSKDYVSDKVRVNLRSEPWISELIENVFFGKNENFKNNPRGNSILFQSIYTVSFIAISVSLAAFIIFYLSYPFLTININISFSDLVKGYFATLAATNGLYWFGKKKLQEKWNYLSDSYNKIIEYRDYTRPVRAKDIKTQIMLNAFAVDLLITEMWGHRFFKELFQDESVLAVVYISKLTEKEAKELLTSFHFTEKELLFILENYQLTLMSYNALGDYGQGVDIQKANWLDVIKTK